MRRLAPLLIAGLAALAGCAEPGTPASSSPGRSLSMQPSFDCGRASSAIEELVCGDEELAAADRRLATTWERVRASLPEDDPEQVRAGQRGWIKGRDECWKAEDPKACVLYAYRSRTADLQARFGHVRPLAVTGYRCEGLSEAVTIAWFGDTEPPAAVITVGGDRSIAFAARSASGARYLAPGVEAWEHQGTLSLDWFGRDLDCSP